MKRVIVAGSRYYDDKEVLYSILDKVVAELGDNIEILSGNCRGADRLGEQYAVEHGITVKKFPAHWMRYGNRAGYIRNKAMAEYAGEENGYLVAFLLGESKGTKMMIDLAKKHGLKICIIKNGIICKG